MTDQSELTALREEVQTYRSVATVGKNKLIVSLCDDKRYLRGVVEALTAERDAATARAERAEEALKNLRGWTGMLAAQAKDLPPDIAEQLLSVCKKADTVLSGDHSEDNLKMVGERERRLVGLVKEAFLQGFDAKDSEASAPTTGISYSERAEGAWERSQAHAVLAEGGGNG